MDVRRVFLGAQLLGDAARPARRRHRAGRAEQRRDRRGAEAPTPSSASWTSCAPSTSAPPTGTTACPRTATSPTPWTPRRAVRLSAPVTVVVAADDPATPEPGRGHRDWQLLAAHVDLHELADGGHYFLRTRPAEAAQAVLGAAGSWRLVQRATNGKDNEMTSSSPASLLGVDLQPGKPPVLRAAAAGDAPGWAAEHRDALRAVVAEHGSVLVRGLGLRDAAGTGAVFRAAGHRPDDREGGVRGPAGLLRRRVLLVEVAAEPADVHAPRAELRARVPRPDAVRVPHRARRRRGDGGGRRAGGARRAARRAGRSGSSGRAGCSPATTTTTSGRPSPTRSAPTTAAPSRATAAPTRSSSSGSPTAGCAPGSAAAPWCVTRSPASAAGSTRSPSSTSGRSTPRCASTWWTSTAPTGCRSTPASAAATRSARTSCSCSTRSTRPTRRASRGRPVTCCWWTTSAPRTAGSPTRGRARCSSRWPTRCAWPTARRPSR